VKLLNDSIEWFNQQVVEGQWSEEDELSEITTPIVALDDIVTQDEGIKSIKYTVSYRC
jgi:hypothetical protein